MKKALLICGALLALAAPAFAQTFPPQVDLTWNGCILDAYAVNVNNACTANTSIVGQLYASFVPHGPLPKYEANICIFDLQTSAAAISPWWDMTATGCSSARLSLDANFLSYAGLCSDFWAGQASTGFAYTVPSPSFPLLLNTARIQTVAGILESAAGPIDNTAYWLACRLTISKTKSTGTGACPGCTDGACIALNQMNLSQPAPTPDDVLTSGPQQTVTYNGAALGTNYRCDNATRPTPTRRNTWGSVKALYR